MRRILRIEEERGRTPRARPVVLVLALAAFFHACGAPGKLPRVLPSRTEAEAATRAGDWKSAAQRWYALFMADPDKPADACAQAARALLELGDADGAAHLLDSGLAAHPEDPDLLEFKGKSLVALGFRRAAEDCFERVLALDPRRVGALLALGKLRFELGFECAAVKPLQRAVDLTGGDFETWRLLAKAQRESGDLEGAYRSWTRAFQMGPGSVEDLVEAATLFVDESFRRSHLEAGEQMFKWLRSAVDRDPKCTHAHFQLGVLSEVMGRREEAIEHYRRALEIEPGCLMALTNLAILYSDGGDERNARDVVSRALTLEHDGNRKKALQRLLEPFESKPKTAETP